MGELNHSISTMFWHCCKVPLISLFSEKCFCKNCWPLIMIILEFEMSFSRVRISLEEKSETAICRRILVWNRSMPSCAISKQSGVYFLQEINPNIFASYLYIYQESLMHTSCFAVLRKKLLHFCWKGIFFFITFLKKRV